MLTSQQKAIRKTAVDWFIRLQDMHTDSLERNKFEVWLMSDVAHQEAYAEVSGAWDKLDSAAQVEQLASALKSKNESSRLRKIKNVSVALSLLVTVCLSIFLLHSWHSKPMMQMVAIAEIGEPKTTVLEDGSKLTINASTHVEVVYYRDKRLVKLNSGEAIFEVAINTDRPFIVESNHTRVTVLGTRFAVNKLGKLTRVSVDHGRVKVEKTDLQGNAIQAVILTNGEVAENSEDMPPKKVNRPASDAFSFERGLITFTDANIQEISETLSRYRQQPVHIKDGQRLNAKITAVIKSRNVENFLKKLPDTASVKLEQRENDLLISEK